MDALLERQLIVTVSLASAAKDELIEMTSLRPGGVLFVAAYSEMTLIWSYETMRPSANVGAAVGAEVGTDVVGAVVGTAVVGAVVGTAVRTAVVGAVVGAAEVGAEVKFGTQRFVVASHVVAAAQSLEVVGHIELAFPRVSEQQQRRTYDPCRISQFEFESVFHLHCP
jgi:hypothetical protein